MRPSRKPDRPRVRWPDRPLNRPRSPVKSVTVCIVATCQIDAPLAPRLGMMPRWDVPGIVAVSDRMLSTPQGSSQPDQSKSFGFGPHIRCWFAGDPGVCEDIVDAARLALPTGPTVRQVAMAVDKAFVAERRRHARFARLRNKSIELDTYKLENQLIVAGVEPKKAHIFVIDDDRRAHRADTIGFAAIGTGSYLAIDYLNRINLPRWAPMPEALFSIYAAKRMAEAAPTVGTDTQVFISRYTKKVYWSKNLLGDLAKRYRQMTAAERRQRDKAVRSLSENFTKNPKHYFLEMEPSSSDLTS